MAALRGEVELEPDPTLKLLISTLTRKAAALGHVRDDLREIPQRVAEEREAIAARKAA